jgi:NAD(P)-dependent dehydrogenase (short-subunit alcohol dehydrogenase family)
MARVLVTGSTTGLGEAAARQLLDEGHEVVLHARNAERAEAVSDLAGRATGVMVGVVLGDLADLDQVRSLADQAAALGPFDAVIHNAGIYVDDRRLATPQGHARPFAVNVLAPYVLTALLPRPARLIYLSSGMHLSGSTALDDLDWTARRWDGVQAYCDSKLHVTALAMGLARRWPDVAVNVVDPGWVPTRMGGPGAPDDLEQGHTTQTWLAVAEDPGATGSGGYWHHMEQTRPAPAALDERFQEDMVARLADLTGVVLP